MTLPPAAANGSEELDKRFDPRAYERAWQRRWAESGIFRAAAPSPRPPFCIVIPPPNVTGRLHVGHALQTALEDLLTRWRRMSGDNALWLPGTDHAGISTQLMVERQLAAEGTDRRALGRERFVERMWAWKRQYHANIREQLDLLGASCDWSRERFTLDAGLSAAVREAFVRLYDEGSIYRGEYLVNWSPVLGTAISDLEVETRTVNGKLYYIAYPLADPPDGGETGEVVVATTRPETMLGDTAIAFHPDDERYKHLHGRAAVLPLVGRRLPFVADAAVDPEFGTGLVKLTPFHDANDFEMARRHGLPGVSVIDQQGRMTAEAGPDFAGLDRFAARAKVVERLREKGLLRKVEDHVHNVGHSERSGEPVEPLISTQWFCDVSGMAARALAAQREGRLRLVPDSWEKTWEHWLQNIRPWCISRQLWWGHQVPAWYTEDGRCFVARSLEEAAAAAGTDHLTQDPDVLDTWFSSGLWPFSTLGWPEKTVDYATFYPTSVLITGYDILFFWVARMAMLALHFTGEVPFAAVHLTGLVRDAAGQKMSKTRGNVLDPIELVEEYGADAVRFTLTSQDIPGRDIALNTEQIAGYRAFGNKIWNAARFALGRAGEARVAAVIDPRGLAAPERWILSRLSRLATDVDSRLRAFRFDEVCNRLYHFFWGDLCDWYIELAKPALSGDAPRPRTGEVLLSVLDRSLRLLHPVMPFLTEEVWQRLPGREAIHPATICLAPYPGREESWESAEVEADMEVLMHVVTRVRGLRAEMGLPPKARLSLHLGAAASMDARAGFLADHQHLIRVLCRVEAVSFRAAGAPEAPGPPAAGAVRRDLVDGIDVALAVLAAGSTGMEPAERERLSRELDKLAGEIDRAERRLADAGFLAKAPPAVVAGGRTRLAELRERQERIRASMGGGA
ncbi:MAG TPA: valine--tRNA ligase [Thermoanaerobaculia bacterium]|nr:valine--tRNA ligase [Thermoanaerobaculia bacterium]